MIDDGFYDDDLLLKSVSVTAALPTAYNIFTESCSIVTAFLPTLIKHT